MSSAGSRFAVWRRVLPLSLQLLALGAGTALAQSNLGAITGIVTDPLNVVALSGAAVFIAHPSTPTGSPSFTLAGGRGRSQMSYIDGGSSQNSRIGNPLIDTDLPSDAVAEVKLLANSASAEFGASAGGMVMTTTKSGTNQFHGSVYENYRNDALDAPGFFAPVDSDGRRIAPELRYNVYGGTVG